MNLDLDPFSYMNGLSALTIMVLATAFGVIFLYRYAKTKKDLLPYVAMVELSFSFLYLGPVVEFFSLLFTGTNISPGLYIILCYTIAPIGIVNWMYLGFSIFKEEWKKKVSWGFGVTIVPYYIALFGFTEAMYEVDPGWMPGVMLDVGLRSVAMILTVVYILAVIVVLGGGFYGLQKKLDPSPERKRARLFMTGWFLFGVGGIIDATIPTTFIVLGRVLMVACLIAIYKGTASTE